MPDTPEFPEGPMETPENPEPDDDIIEGDEEESCEGPGKQTDEKAAIIATVLQGAAVAAAAYNTARVVELAIQEYDNAKRYYNISRWWHDYYRNNFAPVEDQEVEEALALEDEEPLYDVSEGRARVAASMEFRGLLQRNLRCMSSYCSGLRQDILVDILTAQSDALALAEGLGYRNERAYIESRSDVRFEKMLNTAKRGRDMVADNVSLAKAAANIYGDLSDQAWAGLEGAGYYIGYKSNRYDTHYPTSLKLHNQGRFVTDHNAHVDAYYDFMRTTSQDHNAHVEEYYRNRR